MLLCVKLNKAHTIFTNFKLSIFIWAKITLKYNYIISKLMNMLICCTINSICCLRQVTDLGVLLSSLKQSASLQHIAQLCDFKMCDNNANTQSVRYRVSNPLFLMQNKSYSNISSNLLTDNKVHGNVMNGWSVQKSAKRLMTFNRLRQRINRLALMFDWLT